MNFHAIVNLESTFWELQNVGPNGKLERFHGLSPLHTYIHTYIWPNMNPLRAITLGLVWTFVLVLDQHVDNTWVYNTGMSTSIEEHMSQI